MAQLLWQPSATGRIGDFLLDRFVETHWVSLRAAVAFVKRSGAQYIAEEVHNLGSRAAVEFIVGVDHRGTSVEGLETLRDAVAPNGRVVVYHSEGWTTFHPKMYLFESADRAVAVVGSGNLTAGGLFTNQEAAIALDLDLGNSRDRALVRELNGLLDRYVDPAPGTSHELTPRLLAELVRRGYVVAEALVSAASAGTGSARAASARVALFGTATVHPPPARPARAGGAGRATKRATATAAAVPPAATWETRGFVMTLQQTDVGTGQVTAGTSRRSPEVFVPLAARDADAAFWGWPGSFTPDPARPGKSDRVIRVRIGTSIVEVHAMTWPVKHDFRLRSESLRSAGNVGDILKLEQAVPGQQYDYLADVVPVGSAMHSQFLALCVNPVRNSVKRWGYF